MKTILAFRTVETSPDRRGSVREFVAKLRHVSQFTLYQARLIYFWAHPILVLLTVIVTLLLAQQYQAEARRSFYLVFETLFPPLAGLLFVPLVLREQQQRTMAFIGTTQCSLQALFSVRLLLAVLFLSGLMLIAGLSLQFALPAPQSGSPFPNPATERDLTVWPAEYLGGPNGALAILLTVGAPTLLLGGIGTTMAHVAADARVGYLTTFALWMFNRAAGITLDTHPTLHHIYLFVRSSGTGDWLTPKLAQLALGIGFLILSWLLLYKPERFLQEP